MSEYDVIVCGAGPAGLSTGISTLFTNKGLNVLVVDSREEVSEEKCGEGISQDWFGHMSKYGKYLRSKLTPKCFENDIYGLLLVLPSGEKINVRTKKKHGWILNKDFFLKNLAEIFEKKGGEIQLNTNIVSPVMKGGVVYGVETSEGKMIKGKCVVDATGLTQTIWRKALNITEPIDKKDVEVCCQYKVVDCDIEDDDLLQIYFNENIAPGGYGWVFPKKRNRANVGVGCQGSRVMSAVPYQEKFWEMLKLNGQIVSKKGGTVDSCNLPESFVWSNLACVGSSARFTSPVHGGGTGPGLFGGYILGKNIGNAFIDKTLIEDALVDYQREIKSIRGRAHEYHYRAKNLLQSCSDEELETIFSSINYDEWMRSMSFTNQEILKIIARISKRNLRLGLKIMKYLGLG
jgi:digeranylgeranylglycerophospholipid reductase